MYNYGSVGSKRFGWIKILDIFKKLEAIKNAGNDVNINWYYEEDDEDMLEAGEDYQAIIKVPFKMIEVQE